MTRPSPIATPRRPGSILLLVLVALVALTLGTGAYLTLMQGEHLAVRRHGRQSQCMALAESGVAYLHSLLGKTDQELVLSGGPVDNAATLQGVLVVEGSAAMDRGRFSVVAPAQLNGAFNGYQFGLQDESSKLNLNALISPGQGGGQGGQAGQGGAAPGGNTAAGGSATDADAAASADAGSADPRERLLVLPGMTIEIADAILDWIDSDASPRTNGAEADYYQSLDPPYSPANGPLASLDELLQVRGVTPELLYGLDQNRNLVIDVGETARGALLEVDTSTTEMNRGWSAYLTVDSVESFRTATGEPRPNVNDQNLQTLYSALTQTLNDEQAKFLILARQYGVQRPGGDGQRGGGGRGGNRGDGGRGGQGGGVEQVQDLDSVQDVQNAGGSSGAGRAGGARGAGGANNETKASAIQLDFQQQPQGAINSLLDLVGATVQVPDGENNPPKTVVSPWQDNAASYADLMTLYDAVAVTVGRVGGRVNVNAAPRTVLRAVPGLDATVVEQILLRRDGLYAPVDGPQRHALWLLTESLVDLNAMRRLEPYVTGSGNVLSGEVVGFFDDGGAVARLFVAIDRTDGTPRLVRREDRTALGPGLAPSILGAQPDE